MKKEHLKQKRQHRDCLKCDKIPCINFYRQANKLNKLEGGELYFLEETIKEKLITPCLSGSLIYPMCQLLVPLYEGKFSSFLLYHQCIRDLRASAFLLLTGHYRSSMQILRPVLENWLTGIYFDTKYLHGNESEKKIVEGEYNKFLNGEFEISEKEWLETFSPKDKRKRKLDQAFLLKWMLKENLISGKCNTELQNKIGLLNKYLHPHYEFTDVGRPSCPSCPSSVKFDEKEYKDCAELFQYITTFLLETIYEYIKNFFPKKLNDEKIKDALWQIKILPDLEKIIDRQIIFSKKLEDFISLLPELEPEDKSKLEGYYFHK